MKIKKILVKLCLFSFSFLFAGDPLSSFTKTNRDIIINSSIPIAVINKKITLKKTQNVLLVADGSFSPFTKNGKAVISISIDNITVSNRSIIDWGTTDNPQTHTFNCIASATLNKGTHIIKLIANSHNETPNTNFKVNSDSGLSVLIDAAPNIVSSGYDNQDKVINFDSGKKGGVFPLPMENIITNRINLEAETNVVTLCSGNSYKYCGEGDALWGIFLNDEDCINNGSSQWSVNDILRSAEQEAPMFLHSLHTLTGKNSISLKAGELSFTYFENPVCYKVDNSTKLISLYGMNIAGKVSITNTYCNREEWGVFGSYSDKKYPPIDIPHEIISKDIEIPEGHNGVLLFLVKFRLQPDQKDIGGLAKLWLNIDGIDVGTIGVQGYKKPNGDSSRTISASYLSSGNSALSVGKHTIKVYLKAEGNFMHIAHSLDLPLVYFD